VAGEEGLWVTSVETMPRSEIESIQEDLLRRQVSHVYWNSRFYRKKLGDAGVKPEDIKGLNDLSKIPLTSREELSAAVTDEDFFGGRLCVPMSKIWQIFNPPEQMVKGNVIVTALTENDREVLVGHLTRHLLMAGLRRGQIVEVQASQWEAIGRIIEAQFTSRRTVQDIIPFTGIPIEATLPMLDLPRSMYMTGFFKPHLVLTMVDFAKLMVNEAKKQGKTPKEMFGTKVVIHRVRPGSPVLDEKTRKEFEEVWGGTHLCMLDIQDNLFFASECHQMNGLHAWEDGFIVETVDPETGEPTAPGEKGLLTITNLWAEATPLIRYKTDHKVTLIKDECGCGRTHVRIVF